MNLQPLAPSHFLFKLQFYCLSLRTTGYPLNGEGQILIPSVQAVPPPPNTSDNSTSLPMISAKTGATAYNPTWKYRRMEVPSWSPTNKGSQHKQGTTLFIIYRHSHYSESSKLIS